MWLRAKRTQPLSDATAPWLMFYYTIRNSTAENRFIEMTCNFSKYRRVSSEGGWYKSQNITYDKHFLPEYLLLSHGVRYPFYANNLNHDTHRCVM